MLNVEEKETLEIVVSELVRMHKSFTGLDVFNRLHKKGIRHCKKLVRTGDLLNRHDVSRSVRNMFNEKYIGFIGYGSTPVLDGPLLYFPLPFHAKLAVAKIMVSRAELLNSINGFPSH